MSQHAREKWEKVERLFHLAQAMPPAEQSEYLRQECSGDTELRLEVEALLHFSESDTGPIGRAAVVRPAAISVGADLSTGTLLGAYRIDSLLGRGGMGEVYLASRADGLFQKQVAAKILRPEAVDHIKRFEAERQILANLEHPGIARLLDGGVTADGRPYLLMEYVEGAPITDYCNQKALPLDERLTIFVQVAEAVAFAHGHQVVHRDLKAGNILVTPAGKAKLLDFGVAKILNASRSTNTGAPMTLSHAAPEQLRGEAITAATDLYALGLVLYELLTGDLPWSGISQQPAAVILHRLLHEEPRLASQVQGPFPAKYLQDGLDRIVGQCLQKAQADRYPDVAGLLDDLKRHRSGEPVSAGRVFSSGRPGLVRTSTDAERRQLSVVFCDLAGSTELSERLDPEAFRNILMAYQKKVAEVVDRYEGYVAQILGDGLLIYFGYPQATGYDAERAVRAGYDVIAAVGAVNESCKKDLPAPLCVRVGVHTGPVVVGQMDTRTTDGRPEIIALGMTTNLAARLQSAAEPNTVVISDATMKLVPGLFITRPLGALKLKGIEQSVPTFQVIQPSGIRTRMEAAESLTPFVGRAQEVLLLQDRWEQIQEGHGQGVLITAEPGLGKSRLLLQFRQVIKDAAHSWLECRCSPILRNSAYQPIVELLQQALQFLDGDKPDFKLQRLEQALDVMGLDKSEAVPLIAPLLNLGLGRKYQASPYGPELKRKKIIDLLTGWLINLAKQQPLLLMIEDLHWADPSTLELLNRVVELLPGSRALLLLTARPEYRPEWPHRNHLTPMILQPLRAKDSGQMLSSLVGQRALHPAVREKILMRAGGVPLFVEELTKSLLESGQLIERTGLLELSAPIDDLSIPATLQDALMARLDRLGAAKDVAQRCAVVGREIPYPLLIHIVEMDEASLRQHLRTLLEAGLLGSIGSPPEITYVFKHALIQDIAYESLLKSSRQHLHGQIALALEQHFRPRAAAEPELLAMHFEKAEMPDKAIQYYAKAAEAYEARQSYTEALALAARGLALVSGIPEGATRQKTELTLWLTTALSVTLKNGFAHPDALSALKHIQYLLKAEDNPFVQLKALTVLCMSNVTRGDNEVSLKFSRILTELGRTLALPPFECTGLAMSGFACWALGKLAEAEKLFDSAIALASRETSKVLAEKTGVDPIIQCLYIKAIVQWLLGYPNQAQATGNRIVEWARGIDHPVVLTHAATCAAGLPVYMREAQRALEASVSAFELCEHYGLVEFSLWARFSRGLALCLMGQHDEGLPILRELTAAMTAMGANMLLPLVAGQTAEQCIKVGLLEEAGTVLKVAFGLMDLTPSHFWQAELYRVKGELLLCEAHGHNESAITPAGRDISANAEAEACYRQALEVSRGQDARTFELRAATSLARLLSKQDRGKEARELLEPVYRWFTEGLTLPDLNDARLVLEGLQ